MRERERGKKSFLLGVRGNGRRKLRDVGDDVQKSLELLDKVLSEFDDIENGNLDGEGLGTGRIQTLRNSLKGRSKSSETRDRVGRTTEDDSPSLGHQSEDDGYMSMNGKRSKFVLGFRPVTDEVGNSELPPAPNPPVECRVAEEMPDFPPPPEEAQRIISNLLPKVSPVNSNKRYKSGNRIGKPFFSSMHTGNENEESSIDTSATTATQTTLPKTRHQRPFGWENSIDQVPLHLQKPTHPHNRYGSLPYEGALNHSRYPPPWMQKTGPLPPRTLACALDKHREVRRQTEDPEDRTVFATVDVMVEDNGGNFSDDSLEDSLPPASKRGSIAWEVPLGFESEETYLTPGSTKVIGRRRRKSTDYSSNSSIHRLKDAEDWPEPPAGTDDLSISPVSESFYGSNDTDDMGLPEALPLDLTFNGTYVIRKGKKKERSSLNKNTSFSPPQSILRKYDRQSSLDGLKKSKRSPESNHGSSTFDNIKQLLKEGLIEGLNDPPPDFMPAKPPNLVRVVSLPALPFEKTSEVNESPEGHQQHHHRNSKCERFGCKVNELSVTLEEAEDELSSLENPSLTQEIWNCENRTSVGNEVRPAGPDSSQKSAKKCREVQTQTDLSDTEAQNDLVDLVEKEFPEISKTKSELEEVEKKIQEIVKIKTMVMDKGDQETEEFSDPWVKVEDKPPDEFPVKVEVLQHDFGPLPPSPVDEDEEEDEVYTDVFRPATEKVDGLKEPFYRCQDPPGSDPSGKYLNRPPEPLPSRASDPIPMGNMTCRSADAGYCKGPRTYMNGVRNENTTERRTLPSEFPGPVSRRRTFQKKSSTLPQENSQGTSCSLPETPIFSRGCDIPRTPHRVGPDAIRPGGLQNSTYRRNGVATNSSNCNTGVSLTGGFNQAMAGAELLRLAGGPGRGWYPRHRQHRPASIEHLDRLPHSGSSPANGFPGPWDLGSARKPMTLPPNITPKFFHRSPRDALRRVTSLLIRGKGKLNTLSLQHKT
ncbi:hypothetical protein RUM43_009032 [Polyplax serrata]|uniref:Uncharacterized protein n=1 Tax=Polyplax serrata TaxID=468196 RepID=A0AAN8S490_POLSC